MATAIEYGLIAALVSVAAIVGLRSATEVVPPSPSPKPEVLTKLVDNGGFGSIYKDALTNCQYLVTSQGMSIRYRRDGTMACPDVSRAVLSLQEK